MAAQVQLTVFVINSIFAVNWCTHTSFHISWDEHFSHTSQTGEQFQLNKEDQAIMANAQILFSLLVSTLSLLPSSSQFPFLFLHLSNVMVGLGTSFKEWYP